MKRIGLFLLTNIAVLLVLGVALQLLGVNSILAENGVDLDLGNLLVFSAVFGFGGSFISLAMSKWMAKRATGAKVIETPQSPGEEWLVQTASRHAQAAGITMPEVAIWDDETPNAFATGARKNKALVAVSTGLLRGMQKNEIDAVLGHEIGHVANGDMVTLTLVQGVLNTFVIFASRIVGFLVDRVVFRNERGVGIGFFISSIVAQILFGILASIIVMWFSRRREFRADEAGARFSGAPNMIAALERLQAGPQGPLPESLDAFGINTGRSRFGRLFMSHPPLEERIAALKSGGGQAA
jgi:heat shock protein HtpX